MGVNGSVEKVGDWDKNGSAEKVEIYRIIFLVKRGSKWG